MNRRQVLAAVAGVGLTGGAGWVALNGLPVSPAAGNSTAGLARVDTLDTRGSSAGEQVLPVPGQPTLIDLFATWCVPCKAQMRSLVPAHERFDGEVAFVSVTNERFGGDLSADDVREWWVEHDGRWTVGHDPESRLMGALGANGLPYLALANAEGEVVWTHRGIASESQLRDEIEAVVDG